MRRVFLDTNVVIDLLDKREPFWKDAAALFTMAYNGQVELYISSLTYATASYLLRKHGKEGTRALLGNLRELSEDARRFVYAHSDRADDISERLYEHPERHVYGLLYDLKGNVASPVQFTATDSTRHFFRGALYFNNVPNKDSIAPMLDYVRQDIIRLMESFEWE